MVKAVKKTKKKPSSSLKVVKKNDSMETVQSTVPEQVDNSPDNMIMIALKSNRTMDEVQKLIDMRNDEIKRIAKLKYLSAMKDFQAICPNLIKSKQVDFNHKDGSGKTSYKYADLAAIQDIIREPLSHYGLSVSWTTEEDKTQIKVTCICSHADGHSESTTLTGEPDQSGKKNNIQSKASTITYLRRYTLTGILGISTGDVDNDGVDSAAVRRDTIVQLVKPSGDMYKMLLKSVQAKTVTISELEKAYQFTDEQMATLKMCES